MNVSLFKRVAVFILGLFITALGVAVLVKANLGVSPLSSVPYVYSLSTPLSIGELTIILESFFILLQIIILRKNYKLIQLVQLPAVIVFGYFIDFAMLIVVDLNPVLYIEQVFICIFACAVLSFGVFLLLKTHLTNLPIEGFALAVAQTYEKEFGTMKISIDSSMVAFGILSSFALLGQIEGIREGTILAALLVGVLIKLYSTKLPMIERWLCPQITPL
ncbi:DUF6198 family protein [Sulfurimonas sp.]|uniref:YczE/YyaS/YitT family protein n=1 Tax=Sulfurimonas sp. TaxID=2022749 RepID=UPI0025D6B2D7|nr:DUF6198 family protein [Sulfurimonas sp.]